MEMGVGGRGKYSPDKGVLHSQKKEGPSLEGSKMKNSVYNMCRKKGRKALHHICSGMWKIISSGNTGSLQKENHVTRGRWEGLAFH